jgi:predicted ATPase/DNA-binding SARP family transcriptional activator
VRSTGAEKPVELRSSGATRSNGDLEVRVLGRLVVARDGTELALGGRRQRLVLARLICDAGCVVPTEQLVDELWGAARPASGTGPLRTYVWQLRRLLGQQVAPGPDRPADESEVLVSQHTGYLLDIDRDRIDSVRFEGLLAAARAAASAQPERALDRLDDALGMWSGPVFGDLTGEPVLQAEVKRLDQLHLGADELRAELLLATGRETELVVEFGALAQAHPGRERLWAMLMIALYRSGRQADALRCFQEARARLLEEMGLEPGPELRELEQAILRQDPNLDGPHRLGPWLGGDDPVFGRSPVGAPNGARPPMPTDPEPIRHNLPRRLTSLVGRKAERATVAQLLERSRLVTLSGSGGCGKTRLALAVGEDVLARFADGVWFVDLSAVTHPDLVARVVADSLGGDQGPAGRLDNVCRCISDQEILLVLDNCEHLVEKVAEVAEELLARCGSLHILATSRAELRLGVESVWQVPGLGLPEHQSDGQSDDAAMLLASDAVQLFVERGRSALADFAPSGDALSAVARICRRLDGIPLAIELSAALVGSVPLADIAERLDDRLRLLTEGHRASLPRHRTLRATFDWSFDLLDQPAQRLFASLGVFVGSFSLQAAEAVTATTPSDPLAVARGLGHLVRTSMVECQSSRDGAQRYRLPEAIRQYAQDLLEHLDDADEIHRRHADHFIGFAEEGALHLHGPAASEWLRRGFVELPNLRSAAAWALSHDDIEVGMRLAGSLHWFFSRMALLDEAARWLDAGLQRRAELRLELQLKALNAAGSVALTRGEISRAIQLGEQGVALARDLDEAHELAVALMVRGAAAVWAGHHSRAVECLVEADRLSRRLGNPWTRAWMLTCRATATHYLGHTERAREQIDEALGIYRSLSDIHSQVLPFVSLALFSLEEGRADEARQLARVAVRLADVAQGRDAQHFALCMLGVVELLTGRLEQARDLLVRSVRDFPGSRNWLVVGRALDGLAGLSMLGGQPGQGALLLGFTTEVRRHRQISAPASWAGLLDEWLQKMRADLGSDDVEMKLARGRTMDLDDAIRLAENATLNFATNPQPRRG